MDEQMIALGRRAVACKGWRWLPGAHWILPGTILNGRYRGILLDSDVVPDLTDPATLGCLLALVREACKDSGMTTGKDWLDGGAEDGWIVQGWEASESLHLNVYPTEAEALVAALEASPSAAKSC